MYRVQFLWFACLLNHLCISQLQLLGSIYRFCLGVHTSLGTTNSKFKLSRSQVCLAFFLIYFSALFCSFFLLPERWIVSSEGVLLIGWGGKQTKANVFSHVRDVVLCFLWPVWKVDVEQIQLSCEHVKFTQVTYLFHGKGASRDSNVEGE